MIIKRLSIYMGILSGIAVFLIACTSDKVLIQKRQDRIACVKTCEKRWQACHAVCRKNCQACVDSSNASTVCQYRRYMHEQYVQGNIVTRDLQSYRDPLQCRKTTCHCLADYQDCSQMCTGNIYKRLQIAPACC